MFLNVGRISVVGGGSRDLAAYHIVLEYLGTQYNVVQRCTVLYCTQFVLYVVRVHCSRVKRYGGSVEVSSTPPSCGKIHLERRTKLPRHAVKDIVSKHVRFIHGERR